MKYSQCLPLVLAMGCLVSSVSCGVRAKPKAANGGVSCIACTVVVALVEQLTELNNSTVVDTLDVVCNFLPGDFRSACRTAVHALGPVFVDLLIHNKGPDVVCHALTFCKTDPGQPTCRSLVPPLEKLGVVTFEDQVAKARQRIAHLLPKQHQTPPLSADICDVPGIKEICKWINDSIAHEKPMVDLDGDLFSTFSALRGSSWRGRDCSDTSSFVHPGTRPINGDSHVDSNCNGIYGVNNKTAVSYEEELCGKSSPRGVAVLGDSISAHFHLPPQWLDATQISAEAFKHLQFVVENEIDFPMMASVTGHGVNEWPEVISGPIDSMYLRLRERNRCNHRDFQNIAHNGEDSSSMREMVKTLSRDHYSDLPLVAMLALVGNDVCNGHPDTLSHMTTTAQMYNNTMTTLGYLDSTLPNNSHVVMVGVADGRVLFDSVGQRVHPVASYWGGFTYGKFYDYMSCLQISPCNGWMTTNATLRDLTSERASNLSDVLRDIAKDKKDSFQNFDLHFLENPITEMVQEWVKAGREPWELIEPSDGFHVNQEGQALIAKLLWKEMDQKFPEILGPVNPNNDEIQKLFGDQGGY